LSGDSSSVSVNGSYNCLQYGAISPTLSIKQIFIWSFECRHFFVLSGFIIFYIHQGNIGKKEKFKEFIVKRFVRIYPIYWVITLSLFIYYLLIPSPQTEEVHSMSSMLQTFLLYPQQQRPLLRVAWTLNHEIKFYLIFSLAILLSFRYYMPIIASWLAGTFILFITEFIGKFELKAPFLLRFLFDSLNLEFAFGCLVAYLVIKYKFKLKKSYRFLLLLVGILLFIVCAIFINTAYPGITRVITYGIAATLIVMGSAFLDINNLLNVPHVLYYLGDASYSIYLTHWLSMDDEQGGIGNSFGERHGTLFNDEFTYNNQSSCWMCFSLLCRKTVASILKTESINKNIAQAVMHAETSAKEDK
jgi:peptidoglycan/LPS O-acetylase OafA/YrhL